MPRGNGMWRWCSREGGKEDGEGGFLECSVPTKIIKLEESKLAMMVRALPNGSRQR